MEKQIILTKTQNKGNNPMSNIETLVLTAEVRVRTSEGEAFFGIPVKGKFQTLGNDHPGQWLKIPAGSKFALCAKFEKTDTFMIALTPKGSKTPVGVILRRMSYDKLLVACEPAPEVKAPEAPSETPAE